MLIARRSQPPILSLLPRLPWRCSRPRPPARLRGAARRQASCAANFIGEHLHPEYAGGWLHVDIAGPSTSDERGTGYGVALTLALLGVDGFRDAEYQRPGHSWSW